eukprot:scaffold7936_cov43-Attheya_sp.AAC.2
MWLETGSLKVPFFVPIERLLGFAREGPAVPVQSAGGSTAEEIFGGGAGARGPTLGKSFPLCHNHRGAQAGCDQRPQRQGPGSHDFGPAPYSVPGGLCWSLWSVPRHGPNGDFQVCRLLVWTCTSRGNPSLQSHKGGLTLEEGSRLFRGKALTVWGRKPRDRK